MASRTTTAISCAETSYTTVEGLQFTLYCNSDTPDNDIAHTGANDVKECLELCTQFNGKLCGAVAFDSNGLNCYLKDSAVTKRMIKRVDGWILGIANSTQLQPLSSDCPGINTKNQTSRNGLDFKIICDQDMPGVDICSFPPTTTDCAIHTTTLGQCLDHCSKMHPLCTGVAWEHSIQTGYLNCYPKHGTARELNIARTAKMATHAAIALFETPGEKAYDCIQGMDKNVTSKNNNPFQLLCGQMASGKDIMVQHFTTNQDCVNSCSTHDDCVGSVFDAQMTQGYENCYIKSIIETHMSPSDNWISAVRQQTNNTSVPKSAPKNETNHVQQSQTVSGSRAWIAGPVIGGIAGIVALSIGTWWWWKRKRVDKLERSPGHGSMVFKAPDAELPVNPMELEADPVKHEMSSQDLAQELDSKNMNVLPIA